MENGKKAWCTGCGERSAYRYAAFIKYYNFIAKAAGRQPVADIDGSALSCHFIEFSIFSVVFQDYRLLALALGENVAAGTEYDAGKVRACLAEAGMEERICDMEEGLETFLYKDFELI